MKSYKKPIMSAEEIEDRIEALIDVCEDDYDYAISGVEKLQRIGRSKEAISLLTELDGVLNEMIERISSVVAGE